MKIKNLLHRMVNFALGIISVLILLFIVLFIFRDYYTKKYFRGDGFSSESMTIYFGLVYSYSLNADIGHIRSQTGYIINDDDKLSFKVFPLVDEPSRYFPKNYYKIYWSGREYLVEEKSMPFFCSSFNSGFNFNDVIIEPFLVNNFNEKSKPTGKPLVPEIFKKHIYDTPIVANVLEKYPDNFSLKINKGKRDNLFIGCSFYDNSEFGLSYDIISMDDSTAIAQDILTYQMSKDNEVDESVSQNIPSLRERYNSLIVGSILSTFNIDH